MSAPAIPLGDWQLLYHQTMASILHAQQIIRKEARMPGIAYGLWNVARGLRNLVSMQQHVYDAMLALPECVVPETMIKQVVTSTTELVQSIEELLDIAKRHKLTNRTLTAGSVESIRRSGEGIAEYPDTLRLSIDPEVEKAIRQGREDFASGHGIPLESLR